MVNKLINTLRRNLNYKFTKKEIETLKSMHPLSDEFLELVDLAFISRLNAEIPKLLNYFEVERVEEGVFIFKNRHIKLKINIEEYVDNPSKLDSLYSILLNNTNGRLHEFTELASNRVKELLSEGKALKVITVYENTPSTYIIRKEDLEEIKTDEVVLIVKEMQEC